VHSNTVVSIQKWKVQIRRNQYFSLILSVFLSFQKKMDVLSECRLGEEEEELPCTLLPLLSPCDSPLHLLARSGDSAELHHFLQSCDPQGSMVHDVKKFKGDIYERVFL
jgi:hypothetical protein